MYSIQNDKRKSNMSLSMQEHQKDVEKMKRNRRIIMIMQSCALWLSPLPPHQSLAVHSLALGPVGRRAIFFCGASIVVYQYWPESAIWRCHLEE